MRKGRCAEARPPSHESVEVESLSFSVRLLYRHAPIRAAKSRQEEMSRQQKKEEPAAAPRPEIGSSPFDNLPVEGWFWELIRRDGRFRKRFEQIEETAREYAATRLSPDEYARRLKSYLAHLRRYGLHTSGPASPEVLSGRMKIGCYLLLPVPGKNKVIAVPRPQAAYRDFGEGLRPGPRMAGPAKTGFNRLQIRKLLRKYGLLEKKGTPESSA